MKDIEQQRAPFEAWAEPKGIVLKRMPDDEYLWGAARDTWEAWQAAIAQDRQSRGEPVLPDEVLVLLNHIEDVLPDDSWELIAPDKWNSVTSLARPAPQPAEPVKCQDPTMGKHACKDRAQCWEPCGELGNSAEHARVAEPAHAALLRQAKEFLGDYQDEGPEGEGWQSDGLRVLLAGIDAAINPKQPGEPVKRQHPDDAAVDAFAAAMKAKLAKKRDEGRGGWETMTAQQLSALLHEHVGKGDPLDVANIAMMLHQNGQAIAPVKGLSCVDIEAIVSKLGMRWDGSVWKIEDADLHPMVRTLLACFGNAAKPDESLPRHVAQTLANAIYETAQKIGIANNDHSSLSVGQCLHLLDCMAQPAASAELAPIQWQDVVKAIHAVRAEAARRGEMFPQTSDDQAEDRAAAHRVADMIEWYATKGGAVAMKLPNWPTCAAPVAAQPDRYKVAFDEWMSKTDFVHKMKLPVKYLGWHRADIMRDLIEKGGQP